MECVKACEYLKHYGRYPRKYVREVYNNLSIVKGTRFANKLINSCALCGLCGSAAGLLTTAGTAALNLRVSRFPGHSRINRAAGAVRASAPFDRV